MVDPRPDAVAESALPRPAAGSDIVDIEYGTILDVLSRGCATDRDEDAFAVGSEARYVAVANRNGTDGPGSILLRTNPSAVKLPEHSP